MKVEMVWAVKLDPGETPALVAVERKALAAHRSWKNCQHNIKQLAFFGCIGLGLFAAGFLPCYVIVENGQLDEVPCPGGRVEELVTSSLASLCPHNFGHLTQF